MIKDDNIVSINMNIVFDYNNCTIEAMLVSDFMTINTTCISKKGYLINESITIDHDDIYNDVIHYLNKNEKLFNTLIKKTEKKAQIFDEKIETMGK